MRLVGVLILVVFVFVGCNSAEKVQKEKETSSEVLQEGDRDAKISPSSVPSEEVETTNSPTPEVKEIITIEWEFEVSYDEDNYDIPKTKVYLILNKETSIREYLGEYVGTLEDYSLDDNSWGFPEDSIIACFGWYAGAGDLLCVVREESDVLAVKHKVIAESGGDAEIQKELDNYTFENILTIPISEDAVVESDKEISLPTGVPVTGQSGLSEGEQLGPDTLQERALAREFIKITNGDSFDLDGDGTVEQITCECESNDVERGDYVLSIGNATYPIYLDNPTDSIYVSHMTKYDESLQVLIDEFGPSDDCETNIFCYEEGKIIYLGSVGGLVSDIKSLGDGLYETTERAQTLQTWYHPRKFYVTGDGYIYNNNDSETKLEKALVRMPNELYPVGTRVILKCNLALLQTQESKREEVQLQQGQCVTLVASDDEEWLYLQSDEGQSGWIRIKDVGDFFDGLWYYD